ncbi:MAG: hypothetical protein V1872_14210, partial [bacterium]
MRNKLIVFISIIGIIIMGSVSFCFAALQYQEMYNSSGGAKKVLLLVNKDIYASILTSLNQYIADLEAEDYRILVTKFLNGSPQEVKDYMKIIRDLKGVVLIGDLPVAWFEVNDDARHVGFACMFPIDLFYMDLDGTWQDADNDGFYDTHDAGSGDLAPEIWLGRLTASPISHPAMDEVGLLKNYFAKNHTYRTGKLSIKQRALSYLDDGIDYIETYLNKAYSDVTLINDHATTNATDYKKRLKEDYEWIYLGCHSNANFHVFYNMDNSPWTSSSVYCLDIRDIDPTTLFYTLDTCYAGRYTSSNYVGGHYTFAKTYGLTTFGSTKTTTTLKTKEFYFPLGSTARKNIGEAFKEWFEKQNLESILDKYYRYPIYGMTLLGDPTLSLDLPIPSIDSITISGKDVTFTGSGKINNGNITNYSWRSDKDGFLSNRASFVKSNLSTGVHTIFFKVQDNYGRWSSEVPKQLTCKNQLPTSLFGYNSLDGYGSFVILFDGSYSRASSGNRIAGYQWDTGGGTYEYGNSTSTTMKCRFTNNTNQVKRYTVSLTVTDNLGSKATSQRIITAYPITPPSVPYNLQKTSVSSNKVTLTWRSDYTLSNLPTSYIVEIKQKYCWRFWGYTYCYYQTIGMVSVPTG